MGLNAHEIIRRGEAAEISRAAAAERVRRAIIALEASGCSIHKIATICGRDWTTVRNWRRTGRIEHFDWMKLCDLLEASGIPIPTTAR